MSFSNLIRTVGILSQDVWFFILILIPTSKDDYFILIENLKSWRCCFEGQCCFKWFPLACCSFKVIDFNWVKSIVLAVWIKILASEAIEFVIVLNYWRWKSRLIKVGKLVPTILSNVIIVTFRSWSLVLSFNSPSNKNSKSICCHTSSKRKFRFRQGFYRDKFSFSSLSD